MLSSILASTRKIPFCEVGVTDVVRCRCNDCRRVMEPYQLCYLSTDERGQLTDVSVGDRLQYAEDSEPMGVNSMAKVAANYVDTGIPTYGLPITSPTPYR